MSETLITELVTFRDWVRWASSEFQRAKLFYGHGTDNEWDEAILLTLWGLNQPWHRLEQIWEARLVAAEKQSLFEAVQRRINERCPLAYITGEAWFAGERYIVNEHTLVPRSPIAELIEQQFQPWLNNYPRDILDLCTGSGCIGIACAREFVDAQVDLIDISPEALEVAHQNIELHQLSGRVRALESDGLSALGGEQYDLIVSNPPYVSEEEYEALPQEYFAEPKLGLTSGPDGFDFVRTLLSSAHKYLKPEGLLVIEVGYGWEAFMAAFPEYPFFWPEFQNGGCGVCLLTREQLLRVQELQN